MHNKLKKLLMVIVTLIVLSGLATSFLSYRGNKNDAARSNRSNSAQSNPIYTLNLLSGKSYPVAVPTTLSFTVQDQTGKVLKDFPTYREYKMHFMVIRTDRTNFQTVYPYFDEANGKFIVNHFTFPTDGQYRILTSFIPPNAQKDEAGAQVAMTPYQDVQVGVTSSYSPKPLGNDSLTNNTNGVDASFFFPPSDDSAGPTNTDFYTGLPNSIAISIEKDGQLYKSLQPYLGGLGHIIMFGPKLEFVHADSQADDINNQGGVLVFNASFPVAGQYRIYLQTQSDNQVDTNEYTLTVKPRPSGRALNQTSTRQKE